MAHPEIDLEMRTRARHILDAMGLLDEAMTRRIATVQVAHTARASTRAGKAQGTRNVITGQVDDLRITVNVALCDSPDKYAQTLAHEWAHILTYVLYPSRDINHGPEWVKLARAMGDDGVRCHNYDVRAKFPHRYTALTCPGCGESIEISKRQQTSMRNRIARGAVYRCRKCRSVITP